MNVCFVKGLCWCTWIVTFQSSGKFESILEVIASCNMLIMNLQLNFKSSHIVSDSIQAVVISKWSIGNKTIVLTLSNVHNSRPQKLGADIHCSR